ncbi:MAG: radical SAM protein [Opitutaceae bacterium]|jgi:DNA repair photolyase|nr:radical SAM protein [Opitutaceae bacterium]
MTTIKEIQVANYLTKTAVPAGDYAINPYVGCTHKCIYCYADFMKRITRHREAWGFFLDVKRCKKPLSAKALAGKKVIISSVTDAYNKHEEKYRVTRGILEQLAVMENTRVTVLTKSSLVLRDMDLFKKMKQVEVAFSMNTLDDTFRRQTESAASSIGGRVGALKELHANGIRTCLFQSPMFPGITGFKEIIGATRDFVDEYWFENLNLYPSVAKIVLGYIAVKHPQLSGLYKEIYADKNISYWVGLEREIIEYCRAQGLNYRMYFYHSKIRKTAIARGSALKKDLSGERQ